MLLGSTLRAVAMPTDIRIIDLMLGFPHTSIEEKRATYDFFRPLLKDEQSAGQLRPGDEETYRYRYVVMPMRI